MKSTVKSKNGTKHRPKTLNLVTTNLAVLPKDTAATPSTDFYPTPSLETFSTPKSVLDDPRRRLYCSDECYNIDLGKASLPTPPQTEGEEKAFPIKRQLYEMPWYRAIDSNGESYGFKSRQQIYQEESDDDQLIMSVTRSPVETTSPRSKRRSAPFLYERSATMGPASPQPGHGSRRLMMHRRDTSRSLPAPISLYSLTSPKKASTLSTRLLNPSCTSDGCPVQLRPRR